MNKIEKGARMGSVDFYVSVAEFFCVSLDYLLTGKKNVEARTKIGVVLDILKDLESTLYLPACKYQVVPGKPPDALLRSHRLSDSQKMKISDQKNCKFPSSDGSDYLWKS